MRPIDADALFEEVKARHDMFADCTYIGDKARRDELSAFMADIVNAPTVDICKGHPDVPDKTFAHAMQALERNYQKALNNPQIHTPIAWALYHTWRQIDTEENRKRRKKDEHDA